MLEPGRQPALAFFATALLCQLSRILFCYDDATPSAPSDTSSSFMSPLRHAHSHLLYFTTASIYRHAEIYATMPYIAAAHLIGYFLCARPDCRRAAFFYRIAATTGDAMRESRHTLIFRRCPFCY